MRAVFVGGGTLSVMTAKSLLNRGHEVVIIEQDKECITAISETLDCGMINGDGSKPVILKEAAPSGTDLLFCLTGDDEANILASLVGRSLGFKRVVTKIEDPELEHICIELGLEDTIIPDRTISRFLADKLEGRDPLELSTMIRDEARIFSFVLPDDFAGSIPDLELPGDARVVCVYRQSKLIIPNGDTKLAADDDVVVIVHRDDLSALEKQWGPEVAETTG
jgi:trk system potassium uptake protein TrkA